MNGRNIILTESQLKGYAKFLLQQKIIREGIEMEYEMPQKIYNIKKYLDKNFAKTTRDIEKGNEMKTYRCAVWKKDIDNPKAKVLFDDQIFYKVQSFAENLFNPKNTEFRDAYLRKLVDAWFRGNIKVVGEGCAIIDSSK